MSDAVIQQAILYVNGLSSRQVLCNCPSCLLDAQGLVERSLIRKSWINPATAKGHAIKYANHFFTDDPLVYNPTPSQPNSSCLSGNVATWLPANLLALANCTIMVLVLCNTLNVVLQHTCM